MKISLKNVIPLPLKDFGFKESDIWGNTYTFESGNYYQINAFSGVGKSTFLDILYGDRRDYQGEVLFNDEAIHQFNAKDWQNCRRTQIAYVLQGLHLFEELTLFENIALKNVLTNHQTEATITQWINQVGLSDHLHRKAINLSYGQRQRIAVIRALCQPFDFIFLDEPFSHLDQDNQTILMDLIIEETKKNNAGILLTSLHLITDLRISNVVKL